MSKEHVPSVNPSPDIMDVVTGLVAGSGAVEDFIGGYRIRVLNGRAFPWHEVLKTLVAHEFKVSVTEEHGNLLVEAQP